MSEGGGRRVLAPQAELCWPSLLVSCADARRRTSGFLSEILATRPGEPLYSSLLPHARFDNHFANRSYY